MVRTRVDSSRLIESEHEREHLRPATDDDLYQPNQFVQVPDDTSGNAVFARAADPADAVAVESPHATSGQRMADVAEIRYPDGTIKRWPYAEIMPAV